MNKLLYLLLIIYPFFSFLLSKDDLLINRIWGLSIFVILFFMFLRDVYTGKKYFNVFYKTAILLGLSMLVSILINQKSNWLDYYAISKYTLAFLVAGAIYNIPLSIKNLYVIFKINRWYLIVFTVVIFFRLLSFGFNPESIILNRDQIWFERPVFFAFFYSAFALTFLLETVLLDKYKFFKYLIFVPPLFLGARSVIIGFFVVFILVALSDITKANFKKIVKIGSLIFISMITYLMYNASELYNKENLFFQILASEADASYNSDYNVNTFSSGRINILNYYFENFKIEHIFFGLGGIDTKYGIGLHNDFLDFFFQYGIFTSLIFSYFYLLKIIFPLFKFKVYHKYKIYLIALVLFYLIQNLTNPFISTLTSMYFFILVVLIFKSSGFLEHSTLD